MKRFPVNPAPNRPHHHDGGLAVHRPKFIVGAIAGQDPAALTAALFRGVFSHPTKAKIWNALRGPAVVVTPRRMLFERLKS